jgi:predicted ATPase
LSAAEDLEVLGREQGLSFWRIMGEIYSSWARGRLGDAASSAAQLQRSLAACADQGERVNGRFFQALLAEIEAETSGVESALTRIDGALADAAYVEARFDLSFIHRLRGNLLARRSPDDPAPAENAYRTSIAVAKEQSARSPVLLASLALAKLLQSTSRPIEAHAVLAPALENFSPTPEMPQIAEAQTLLERSA